jgi:hypothetical protein
MTNKNLKYKLYLDNYNNCPPSDFHEITGEFCRWVSLTGHENDFKPLNMIALPPQRLLDNSDKFCMGYGLSFFDTLQHAFSRYCELYRKQKRAHLKELFKQDKGTQVSLISINKDDGVADEPNFNTGHFTLHEYDGIDFSNRNLQKIAIFEENGTVKTEI